MKLLRLSRGTDWTRDRIAALATPEVRQLRVNALRLSEPEIVALCDEVIGTRPRGGGGRPGIRRKT